MPVRNFNELITAKWNEGKFLSVGLDIDHSTIPELLRTGDPVDCVLSYASNIVSATRSIAAAYKPNLGFYLADGWQGIMALELITDTIHTEAPDVVVLDDLKTGDIGTTAERYRRAVFERFIADSVTLNPYMGQDTGQPYLDHPEKGCVVICKTSNPGSGEFQDRHAEVYPHEESVWGFTGGSGTMLPMYEIVARRVSTFWNQNKNCGLVVGATYPEQMQRIRSVIDDEVFILAPGIGKQEGDLKATVQAAKNKSGRGFLVNVSSAIDYASPGPDFAEAARAKAQYYHSQIRACLE